MRELDELLIVARTVADEAARILATVGSDVGVVRSKSTSRDLVTDWDTRVEDHIRKRLAQLTPEIPMLGEERGNSGGLDQELESGEVAVSSDWWVVDPIDGTVNFSHGIPVFSVVIALERNQWPVVGVIRAPALGWEMFARQGGGAYWVEHGQNSRNETEFATSAGASRVSVSAVDSLERAMLATGFPYDRATNPDNNFAAWEHFQRRAGACRRFGCASLDLCMVARGWLDGYWERRLKPWDLSAGALLVAEAGGAISAFDGGRFVSQSGELVASNGRIHQELLDELASISR